MRHIFTAQESQFIMNNYPSEGRKFCAEKLGLTEQQIKAFVNNRNIRLMSGKRGYLQGRRLNNVYRDSYFVSSSGLTNPTISEAAYCLGLLWADGYVSKRRKGNRLICVVKLKTTLGDGLIFENILRKLGKWTRYESLPIKGKRQLCLSSSCRPIVDFLIDYDYTSKTSGPDRILSLLPENLQNFFFLGLIDGDGCFYLRENRRSAYLSITGPFEQDWNFLKRLSTKLNVKYSIHQSVFKTKSNKIHKSSCFAWRSKIDIATIGDFLYKDFSKNGIGLPRKHQKFLEIKGSLRQPQYSHRRISVTEATDNRCSRELSHNT